MNALMDEYKIVRNRFDYKNTEVVVLDENEFIIKCSPRNNCKTITYNYKIVRFSI